ncbi:methylenetetrahydrofolate reductase [NAD(P)H] [Teredinibacter turnerae]|uniref:Methylenetetrahydrofolate reductase n=1 Tax=Teredinibacter turnerae (strain ATCC 39867 / T7901) TaxID=377629 RepID=C5BTQ6_TERTT|nr:methylenetetrahydrofolate reductase [NAD(P)H] [Teredinibacter turnerae]ACR11583.1 methylenetetrahydrofolate reductase [Teredinibacter turnerae T7901]
MTDTNNDISLSFEFFPPKSDAGREKLQAVRTELNQLKPDFFSVTYGAGGSTRENTKGVIKAMRAEGLSVAPHLSFGGDDEDTMIAMIEEYKAAGVDRIVALRGDMPSGMGAAMQLVYANELVAFIRKHFGSHFELCVAAYPEIHPEAKSYLQDIRYLKGKFDAGANCALTQYFYNPDSYFYFVEECAKEGIEGPIIPGIMPITNYQNIARFSDACGAEIPRWIRKRLNDFGDNQESLQAFTTDLVTELCATLLENGAPGLHFYTMNQVEPTRTILTNLGLVD